MKNIVSKASIWVIWLLIVLLALSLVKNIGRTKRIGNQIHAEKEKLAKIQSENEKIASELEHAQSADFIEKQVRDKLGLGHEGEAIVVLPDDDILKKLAPQIPTDTETLPEPIWKKWVHLFN